MTGVSDMPCNDPNLTEIMVPRHLKERLKSIAKTKGINMQAMITRCFNAYCREEGISGETDKRPIEAEEFPTFKRPASLRGRPRCL